MINFFYILLISPLDNENQKFKNILLCIIAILPPNIFMFYLYQKNAEYINFWHVFILAIVFSCVGFLMHWIISRLGKSPAGSALVCFFLWIMFFTIYSIYQNLSFLYHSELSRNTKLILLLVAVLTLAAMLFMIGRCLKHIKIFKAIAVFQIVIFLIIFAQAVGEYILKITFTDSDANYKTSFTISPDSLTPNIYWIFMDGMLGFEAVEYFFDDPQAELEAQLKERGFTVNREAVFEAHRYTKFAIPILMSPFFYDKVVLPQLNSIDLSDLFEKRRLFQRLENSFNRARLNNELILAFNTKGYHTAIIVRNLGYYWHPTATISYTPAGKIENNISNLGNSTTQDQLIQLNDLMSRTTISRFVGIGGRIHEFIDRLSKSRLDIKPVKGGDYAKGLDGISAYKNATWYLNALTEVLESPQPRMIIIEDDKAHFPFLVVDEDGSRVTRSEKESSNIYNYPLQHNFARKYLIALIDFILANDPEAVIVVQSDHGLHSSDTERQIFSSGGTVEEVLLIYNQTMSAVRIPDVWGGLDAPLDPRNITRVLVNRYVGQNYELLEDQL